MSYREEMMMSLAGIDVRSLHSEELLDLYNKLLQSGMHGLCFSPYTEGQGPGEQLTKDQIRQRLEIIQPYTNWVRSFSCTEGNELIPELAKEYGMNTLVGAWLGDDPEINEREIEGLINVTRAGFVDIAAVGNEVLYRNDLSEEELLAYMARVKQAIPDTPMGYVDAYYEFSHRKGITDACDVILANCYPYWEGCHIDYSLVYMKGMYNQAVAAAGGKPVIITETGWPSQGSGLQGAEPSAENFMRYFINAQKWTKEDGIEIFYFSSFDESWKEGTEGDVGPFWGIWDKNGELKFS